MRFLPLTFLALCAATVPAQKTFTVELVGGQQTPPVTTTAGIGPATVTLDIGTRQITVTGTYTNLGSDAFAAHIHGPARRGDKVDLPLVNLPVSGGTTGTHAVHMYIAIALPSNPRSEREAYAARDDRLLMALGLGLRTGHVRRPGRAMSLPVCSKLRCTLDPLLRGARRRVAP